MTRGSGRRGCREGTRSGPGPTSAAPPDRACAAGRRRPWRGARCASPASRRAGRASGRATPRPGPRGSSTAAGRWRTLHARPRCLHLRTERVHRREERTARHAGLADAPVRRRGESQADGNGGPHPEDGPDDGDEAPVQDGDEADPKAAATRRSVRASTRRLQRVRRSCAPCPPRP